LRPSFMDKSFLVQNISPDHKTWMTRATPGTDDFKGWYHPTHVATLDLWNSATTYTDVMNKIESDGTFASALDDDMIKTWINYMVTERQPRRDSQEAG
jgi:hypothetical protein